MREAGPAALCDKSRRGRAVSVRRDGRHSLPAVVALAAGPVAVAAPLFILFLVLPGPGGRPAGAHPAADSGPTRLATTAPAGDPSITRMPAAAGAAARSASPSPSPSPPQSQSPHARTSTAAPHADPLAGAAAPDIPQRTGTVLAAVHDV